MTVNHILTITPFRLVAGQEGGENEISGVYISDLLSDVMGKTQPGQLWLTIQGHSNIVAVAALKELAAILITGNNPADPLTLEKAEQEKIPILVTDMTSYQAACCLCRLNFQ